MGMPEKDRLGMGERRSEGNDNWNSKKIKKRKKNPEVALESSVSKKYIAILLTLCGSLAHVPGEGLHFAKEVMQTCLHLVTMDMALCESKPPICIANNQEQWRTPSLIFWPQSVPGSSSWLITSKTITSFGSALGTRRTRVRDVVFQMKMKRQNHTHLQNKRHFLCYLVWNS